MRRSPQYRQGGIKTILQQRQKQQSRQWFGRGGGNKQVNVDYTLFLGAPDERKIANIISDHARQGWLCVGRREEEGIFGFGAHTVLTFQRNR